MVIRVPKFVFLSAQERQHPLQSQHHNRPTHSGLKYLGVLTVVSLSTSVVSGAAATGTSTVSSSTLVFVPSARPQFRNADFSCNSSPYSSRHHACRFGASVEPRGGPSRYDGSIVSSMTNRPVMSAGGMLCGPLLTAVGSVIGRRRRGQEDLRSSDSTDGVSVTQAKEAVSGGGRGSRSPSGRLSWRRGEWCSTGSSSSALGSSGKGVNGDRTGSSRSYTPWGGGDSPLWVTGESVGRFGGATATVTATAAAVEEPATSRDKVWSSSEEADVGGERDTGIGDVVVSDQDVVGDDGEGPKLGGIRIGADLMGDFRKRSKLYASDWTDGLNRKSVPAILFLYFACLLPAVAFGGIASQVTQGTLGVIEYLASCGLGGMAYATLSGQPMTFIGPTGLTLAFMTSLYSFTSLAGLPFLPVYAWVGMWTSCFLMTLSLVGASNLIRYATQFTDDVFNALLSVNFIYEAARSLMRNFNPAVAGYSQAGALMSLNVAVATYVGCRKTSAAQGSGVFNKRFREFVSDFGPLMVIVLMSCFCALPSCKGLLSFLEVPSALTLGHGRSLLVPIFSVRPVIRMASALPAMLLTSLFFLDQNISSRVVNSPRHKMVKGPAYHQDMLVLGMITGVLSIVGLPWQCAATVQSLNHVRQMATFRSSPLSESTGKSDEIESLYETRLTGFCVHALVLASLALLPQLSKIPMAVVSGIFLYLGRKVMSGNAFLIRVKEVVADRDLLSANSDIRKVGFRTALKYTAVQTAMLALLWTLKSFGRTALFFPSVIGLLIIVRLFALPKMFTSQDLSKLDAAVG